MENPVKQGVYISTSSPIMAKEFSFKQARTVLNNRSKKMKWIDSYYMVDKKTGQVSETPSSYKGNAGVYIGENDIEFDNSIISKIYEETESITGLAGWSMTQLKTYEEQLNIRVAANVVGFSLLILITSYPIPYLSEISLAFTMYSTPRFNS